MVKALDIEKTVMELVITDDLAEKRHLVKKIFDSASEEGAYPQSIHEFYTARGRREFSGFTVPAINLRSMTYDLARAIFRVALKNDAAAFIFEIARSEIGYTDQPPIEYAGMVMAAALKEGYSGPVFIQGDHFQANAAKFKENPDKEIQSLQALISEAISSGFYNIDIDSSTLVDMSKTDLEEQQLLNYEVCAKLTQYVRSLEPKGMTISVGGEIGEIGRENSTPEELRAFMSGFRDNLDKGLLARFQFRRAPLMAAWYCLTGQSLR